MQLMCKTNCINNQASFSLISELSLGIVCFTDVDPDIAKSEIDCVNLHRGKSVVDLKDISEIVQNLATAVAILIGGGWTLWNFVLRRDRHPKVQFNVDLKVIGTHKEGYIVEVIAIIENKGIVRKYMEDFRFDLLILSEHDIIKEGGNNINGQVLFRKIIDKRSWIPPGWEYSFIDSSVTQHYANTTIIPLDAKFAIVHGHFKYADKRSEAHTAHKTFLITQDTSLSVPPRPA